MFLLNDRFVWFLVLMKCTGLLDVEQWGQRPKSTMCEFMRSLVSIKKAIDLYEGAGSAARTEDVSTIIDEYTSKEQSKEEA